MFGAGDPAADRFRRQEPPRNDIEFVEGHVSIVDRPKYSSGIIQYNKLTHIITMRLSSVSAAITLLVASVSALDKPLDIHIEHSTECSRKSARGTCPIPPPNLPQHISDLPSEKQATK